MRNKIDFDNQTDFKISDDLLLFLEKIFDKILLDPNPLSQLTRLRQATANPSLLTTKKVSSSKLERMVELVEESVDNGDKVIIFSNYSKNIYEAVEMLKRAKQQGIDTIILTPHYRHGMFPYRIDYITFL